MPSIANVSFVCACLLFVPGLLLSIYWGIRTVSDTTPRRAKVLATCLTALVSAWPLYPFALEGLAVIAGETPVPNYDTEVVALPIATAVFALALSVFGLVLRKGVCSRKLAKQ